MNKHELFDLIGEADEDYVLAADRPAQRARPRWRIWAACAACAALVIGAYPLYNALRPQQAPLHDYTVVEGGGTALTAQSGIKAPPVGGGGEIPTPDPMPDPPDPGPDRPFDPDYTEPVQGPPDQAEAITQYDNLLRSSGISDAAGKMTYPDWYGGAWLDNDWPDNTARLTVAIVDGFRTRSLEAQILEWCGGTGDVLFCGAKYSRDYLQNLMERMNRMDESLWSGTHGSHGVDVTANCVGVDIFADTAPEGLLAALAELDPDGDAIRVQVHTGQTITAQTINTDIVKGPPPAEPADDPVAPEARATPSEETGPVPGGRTDPAPAGAREDGAQEAPGGEETCVPAQYGDPLPLEE